MTLSHSKGTILLKRRSCEYKLLDGTALRASEKGEEAENVFLVTSRKKLRLMVQAITGHCRLYNHFHNIRIKLII